MESIMNEKKLFIRIVNGQPFEHPIMEDNFLQAFPDVDINNLPPEFARFERIEFPVLGVYEVYTGATYERDGDVYKDVHHVRQMTEEEKTEKQNSIKAWWESINGFPSWVFDEDLCNFRAPVPYPNNEKMYNWDESTMSWVEAI